MILTGILEKWTYVPYSAPGDLPVKGCLAGEINGDHKKRFKDGTYVTTSSFDVPEELKTHEDVYDWLEEGFLIATRNSVYQLGERA